MYVIRTFQTKGKIMEGYKSQWSKDKYMAGMKAGYAAGMSKHYSQKSKHGDNMNSQASAVKSLHSEDSRSNP